MTMTDTNTGRPLVYPYGPRHTPEMVDDLARRASEFRIQVLRMVYAQQTGHIGGAFSVAEILTALFFHHLRIDPAEPNWPERDRLVFSKGHACAMLYTCMAHRGYFPVDELATFRCLNSCLQGHPERQKTPGIEIPAGPLGHGVAVGAGMALAARMDAPGPGEPRRRVYVVLGDGEINAGVIWEGALVAAKYRLDNLVFVIDKNKVQAKGFVSQDMGIEPLADKLRAFGLDVHETGNGHDVACFWTPETEGPRDA